MMVDWEVRLGQYKVDTVFFDDDMDADTIRRSLIVHDGYHPQIRVTPGPCQQVRAADEGRRRRNQRRYGMREG